MSTGKSKKQKRQSAIQEQPSVISSKYLILSFALPFVILGAAFILKKIFPFGGNTILIHDFHHQYYPFLSSLWHKLREGTMSVWSWTAGMGHDYIALIAYYMASPLNLLAMLTPHAWLLEMLTLILLIKIGCAGLFTAMFLRRSFMRESRDTWHNGIALAVFSSLYALCAFAVGYFHSIMWLDSFALLPLVMMGLLALMREGKYLLYTGALAMAVFANFYIGFFICVSAAMFFIAYSFMCKLSLRTFMSKLGAAAACSALAVGMAAALLLPMYFALQSTYAIENASAANPGFYTSFFNILGNFIAFMKPTYLSGLPNLYSGMASVLLACIFAVSAKITLREKLLSFGAVVFLILSCNLGVLDYIMHGFHNTNDLPFRFTFLISFMLVVMAYRAFMLADSMTMREGKISLLAMGICAALFLLSAVIGTQNKNAVIGSAVLCVFYLLLFLSFFYTKKIKSRINIKAVFILAVAAELFITVHIGINSAKVIKQSEVTNNNYEQVQELLALRGELPDAGLSEGQGKASRDFYRTEILPSCTRNDPHLYNYDGITFFSSTMNDDVMRFIKGLGMPVGVVKNSFIYHETSPLFNSFLNMRYMVVHRGTPADKGTYWEFDKRADNILLMKYKYYLPLGFMTNGEISAYKHNPKNPFLSQNDLFRRAAGIEGNLFDVADLSVRVLPASDGSGPSARDYEMPFNGMLYFYFDSVEKYNVISISVNGQLFLEFPIFDNIQFISIVGEFSKGDIISFMPEGSSAIYAGCFNFDLFKEGYALLADEVLNLTYFSETKVRGTVTALKDGILYTSIPGKNWHVYVDGVKSELLLIDNVMAAVRLPKGTHEVEFRYLNKSFTAGAVISIVSLIVYVLLLLMELRKQRKTAKLKASD